MKGGSTPSSCPVTTWPPNPSRSRQVYDANTAREPWQAGDLMLVDNVRTAHSREPYEGPREVLVSMADPVRLTDCSPTVDVTG